MICNVRKTMTERERQYLLLGMWLYYVEWIEHSDSEVQFFDPARSTCRQLMERSVREMEGCAKEWAAEIREAQVPTQAGWHVANLLIQAGTMRHKIEDLLSNPMRAISHLRAHQSTELAMISHRNAQPQSTNDLTPGCSGPTSAEGGTPSNTISGIPPSPITALALDDPSVRPLKRTRDE